MNPQEQQLLQDFLQRLAAVRGVTKDVQADALIQQQLAGHPDALYLLVQRSLLQQAALDNAKAQIAQLQAQVSGQGGSSFLGGQAGAWSQPQQPSTPPPMPQQQAAAPGWRERLFGGGAAAPQQPAAAPGFLASAATTAAGVAGGMFLFNGIESLLGGHHGGGLFGGGGQETVVENITQNNFYDDNNNALQNDHSFAQDNNDFNGDLSDIGDVGFDDDNDNSWA